MKRKEFLGTTAGLLGLSSITNISAAAGLHSNSKIVNNTLPICFTCGTQYKELNQTNNGCPICKDDRQYVAAQGQTWTDLQTLQSKYSNTFNKINDNLYEIKTTPKFAINQRAFLIITPGGNILWDCIALINQPTIEFIRSKGPLKAIAISHPHYFTTMNEWAKEFDCPIFINQADEEWIFNKGKDVSLWDSTSKELWDGIQIINIGGHFPGSSILRVPSLSSGGTIFVGDTFQIGANRKHISVMYSYPNFIPVSIAEINRIKKLVPSIQFDSMYGAFDNQQILGNAKDLLKISLEKYV